MREQFIEVPSQTTITKDNAPINVDFLIYWRIVDPLKSVVNVANFAGRAPGRGDDDPARGHRRHPRSTTCCPSASRSTRSCGPSSTRVTERWGGKITTVEIREITPPRDVQDAMNRQLSAERTRRAVITESEGARQSAINVAEGQKQSEILKAEGDRQAAILRAEGFSEALTRIYGAASGVDSEDDGPPVPRGAQGDRGEPVHEVRHPARVHPAAPSPRRATWTQGMSRRAGPAASAGRRAPQAGASRTTPAAGTVAVPSDRERRRPASDRPAAASRILDAPRYRHRTSRG